MEARGGPRRLAQPGPAHSTHPLHKQWNKNWLLCVCVCASPLRNAPWCWWELVLIKGSRWWSRCVREESQKGQERCVTHHCRVLSKLKGVMSPEHMKIPPDANDCNGFSLCTREVRLSFPGPDWLRPWVFRAPFDFSAWCLTFMLYITQRRRISISTSARKTIRTLRSARLRFCHCVFW